MAPQIPLRIRRSQNVNRCQLARRLGQLAAWGMNTTTTTTHNHHSIIIRQGLHANAPVELVDASQSSHSGGIAKAAEPSCKPRANSAHSATRIVRPAFPNLSLWLRLLLCGSFNFRLVQFRVGAGI